MVLKIHEQHYSATESDWCVVQKGFSCKTKRELTIQLMEQICKVLVIEDS